MDVCGAVPVGAAFALSSIEVEIPSIVKRNVTINSSVSNFVFLNLHPSSNAFLIFLTDLAIYNGFPRKKHCFFECWIKLQKDALMHCTLSNAASDLAMNREGWIRKDCGPTGNTRKIAIFWYFAWQKSRGCFFSGLIFSGSSLLLFLRQNF
jgi:hypothetical protein